MKTVKWPKMFKNVLVCSQCEKVLTKALPADPKWPDSDRSEISGHKTFEVRSCFHTQSRGLVVIFNISNAGLCIFCILSSYFYSAIYLGFYATTAYFIFLEIFSTYKSPCFSEIKLFLQPLLLQSPPRIDLVLAIFWSSKYS